MLVLASITDPLVEFAVDVIDALGLPGIFILMVPRARASRSPPRRRSCSPASTSRAGSTPSSRSSRPARWPTSSAPGSPTRSATTAASTSSRSTAEAAHQAVAPAVGRRLVREVRRRDRVLHAHAADRADVHLAAGRRRADAVLALHDAHHARLHPVDPHADADRARGRRELGELEGQPALRRLRGRGDDRARRDLAVRPLAARARAARPSPPPMRRAEPRRSRSACCTARSSCCRSPRRATSPRVPWLLGWEVSRGTAPGARSSRSRCTPAPPPRCCSFHGTAPRPRGRRCSPPRCCRRRSPGCCCERRIEARLGTPATLAAGLLAGAARAGRSPTARRPARRAARRGLARRPLARPRPVRRALAGRLAQRRDAGGGAGARVRAGAEASRLSWEVGLPVLVGAARAQAAAWARPPRASRRSRRRSPPRGRSGSSGGARCGRGRRGAPRSPRPSSSCARIGPDD